MTGYQFSGMRGSKLFLSANLSKKFLLLLGSNQKVPNILYIKINEMKECLRESKTSEDRNLARSIEMSGKESIIALGILPEKYFKNEYPS